MEIHLTPDQEAFIREAIAHGRVQRPEEAVEQAMRLWEERERTRLEILAALEAAELDIKAGRYIEVTDESMKQLAEDVKQRGRALKAKEQIVAAR
ncbi:putative addiction module CopG family antidote [Silvibacterium bohemicum]|uniref:Putative addiction module CopG family antidote n=1 Tax=Silvibacterium bohemicum TaxID=1577686 RepID=A0A841JUP8_9BACT|nr:type II toxin-antitoxin system ParD family antitoxin [Silvibacterium bohemicum]MBB6142148.1 putative addiction module CopG family antidote [Silvibacterium bohemicum]